MASASCQAIDMTEVNKVIGVAMEIKLVAKVWFTVIFYIEIVILKCERQHPHNFVLFVLPGKGNSSAIMPQNFWLICNNRVTNRDSVHCACAYVCV